MEPAEQQQDRAPAHVHTDELPPWLAPGASPVPPGPLSKPAVAWGGTLTATALMVAFGLWLGDVPAPPPVAALGPQPVPSATRPAPSVPQLVLTTPAAMPAATPAVEPPVIAKRPAVVRRHVALASAKPPVRARPRVQASSAPPRTQFASIDSGEGQRIRCKHGELARECLARYR